jgi:signal peptidase I
MVVFAVAIFTLFELAMPRSIVDGRSMEPSFVNGERLVISRVHYWLGDPERGDIIVFNSPKPRSEDESALVKRLIGLPGDTIEFRDQQLYINGEILEEPYINEPCSPYRCEDEVWHLGPDEYFMMGDNRNVSNDSRAFGPVPHENVVGEVLFRYWPLDRFGVVQKYRFPSG